jgi:hypothetical protein
MGRWVWLNKFSEGKMGDFTGIWGQSGAGYPPDGFAKMGMWK